MRSFATFAILAAAIASPVLAVCPGYNFALQDLGNTNCTFAPWFSSRVPSRLTSVMA